MRIWQGNHIRPDRPVVVYDGDCAFCRRQIRRLDHHVPDAFEYVAFQEAGHRFDPIPHEQFVRSVVLIQKDGETTHAWAGAEAIYRALAHNPRLRLPLWLYNNIRGFSQLSEASYRFVARNRGWISQWFPWI